MNWIHKCKILAIETVKYNRWPYIEINNLWYALHSSFNKAQDQQINKNILNEIAAYILSPWIPFSEEEFTSAIAKYNNLFAPGLDKLL